MLSGKTWLAICSKIGFALVLLFCSPETGLAQQPCTGTPTITKWVSPLSVEAGEPVSILIKIDGCSGEVTEPIPFDGVLLIDMSNSMDDDPPYSDPNDKRLDAATNFVKCVSPDTRLAIVTFSTEAELVQGLTNDKPILESKIDQLRGIAEGGTNMYEGMQIAQQHLMNLASSRREQYVILLTDGDDNWHNDQDFISLANDAADNNIRYLNISLGQDANLSRLIVIATLTDGNWFPSVDASELEAVYGRICHDAGRLVRTRNIILEEKVDPGVQVVPGSFDTDIESIIAQQIGHFEATGQITAEIGTLGLGQGKYISFDVVSDCLTPDAEIESVEVNIDDPASMVAYTFGTHESAVAVPTKQFECLRPGDLRVQKAYDFQTATLSITLESRYLPEIENNIIRNLEVIERPSIFFQPDLSTTSQPALVFPGATTDVLIWKIAELGPGEVRTFSVDLIPRVCSDQYDPPIDVNANKLTGGTPGKISYVRPNGTQNSIDMPFWTTSLPTVDVCRGRPDITIDPAYAFGEYESPPEIDFNSLASVWFRDDSPSIWIDSNAQNDFWDGTNTHVSDFINGAGLQGSTSRPIEERIQVVGQGDIFYPDSENIVFAKIVNYGDALSEAMLSGARLYAYNHTSSAWDLIATENLPQILSKTPPYGTRGTHLVRFPVPSHTLQQDHLKPYAYNLQDVISLIAIADPSLAGTVEAWWANRPYSPEIEEMLEEILPEDILRMLSANSAYRTAFEDFLRHHGNTMAWGKQSAMLKVILAEAADEKHTNNNSSTEIIIVNQ